MSLANRTLQHSRAARGQQFIPPPTPLVIGDRQLFEKSLFTPGGGGVRVQPFSEVEPADFLSLERDEKHRGWVVRLDDWWGEIL